METIQLDSFIGEVFPVFLQLHLFQFPFLDDDEDEERDGVYDGQQSQTSSKAPSEVSFATQITQMISIHQ